MNDLMHSTAVLEETIYQRVAANIADFMPGLTPDQISIDARMADYGCNSIDRMDIVWQTLDDLQLEIPIVEFAQVQDIRGLVGLLSRHVGAR